MSHMQVTKRSPAIQEEIDKTKKRLREVYTFHILSPVWYRLLTSPCSVR